MCVIIMCQNLTNNVNVDSFAQINFPASSLKRQFHMANFFRHRPVNSVCHILITTFTYIKFKTLREMRKICTVKSQI